MCVASLRKSLRVSVSFGDTESLGVYAGGCLSGIELG